MASRDRSNELYQLFDSLRHSSNGTTNATLTSSSSSSATPDVKVFNEFAAAFAKEISSVSESIMNLTKLSQRQTVFDDESQEISGLVAIVKTNLHRLHDDLETLSNLKEQALRSQRGSLWSSVQRKEAERHSDAVVDTLKSRLARTGQDFKSVLQQRTRSMKEDATRRHQFTSDRTTTFESALFRDQRQHEEQQILMTNTNSQYYRQRTDAVREIEAAVHEVGELFQDFTRIVHEQDELIVRIDANVEDALTNVHAGSSELMRYLANLSSNRGLILKVFAILFAFLLFFGFVVVR